MHQVVYYLAVVWMSLLFAAAAIRVIRPGSPASRVLALDVAALIIVGLLVLFSAANGVPYFLDAALALALLSFAATLAAARFTDERGPFS